MSDLCESICSWLTEIKTFQSKNRKQRGTRLHLSRGALERVRNNPRSRVIYIVMQRLLVSRRSSLSENSFEEYWQGNFAVLFDRLNHDSKYTHACTRAQEIESFRERYTDPRIRRAVSKRANSISIIAARDKNKEPPGKFFRGLSSTVSLPGTFSAFPRRTSPRSEAKSIIFQ